MRARHLGLTLALVVLAASAAPAQAIGLCNPVKKADASIERVLDAMNIKFEPHGTVGGDLPAPDPETCVTVEDVQVTLQASARNIETIANSVIAGLSENCAPQGSLASWHAIVGYGAGSEDGTTVSGAGYTLQAGGGFDSNPLWTYVWGQGEPLGTGVGDPAQDPLSLVQFLGMEAWSDGRAHITYQGKIISDAVGTVVPLCVQEGGVACGAKGFATRTENGITLSVETIVAKCNPLG
jgi:hypothetical protein